MSRICYRASYGEIVRLALDYQSISSGGKDKIVDEGIIFLRRHAHRASFRGWSKGTKSLVRQATLSLSLCQGDSKWTLRAGAPTTTVFFGAFTKNKSWPACSIRLVAPIQPSATPIFPMAKAIELLFVINSYLCSNSYTWSNLVFANTSLVLKPSIEPAA